MAPVLLLLLFASFFSFFSFLFFSFVFFPFLSFSFLFFPFLSFSSLLLFFISFLFPFYFLDILYYQSPFFSLPGRTLFVGSTIYTIWLLCSVWVVAYPFVPFGGELMRERTHFFLFPAMFCVFLGSYGGTPLFSSFTPSFRSVPFSPPLFLSLFFFFLLFFFQKKKKKKLSLRSLNPFPFLSS
jgi:hypothetical protein